MLNKIKRRCPHDLLDDHPGFLSGVDMIDLMQFFCNFFDRPTPIQSMHILLTTDSPGDPIPDNCSAKVRPCSPDRVRNTSHDHT